MGLHFQLKGRLTFDKKYLGKDIYIAFRSLKGNWFLYQHDELLNLVFDEIGSIQDSKSWKENGLYTFPRLGLEYIQLLLPYQLNRQYNKVH